MEYPRCLHQEQPGRARRRFQALQPARARLQHAGEPPHVAGRTAAAPAYAARSAGSHSLSHILLPRRLGFLSSHTQAQSLPDGTYDVVIDSELRDGNLVYGEYLHQGDSSDEVLLSAHACHPSLANDNCSGLAVLARLAASLKGRSTRLSYRFLFAPGTIGAIAWLSRNEAHVHRIKHGLVVAGVGDPGRPTYKRSRRGDAMIDRVLEHVLRQPAFDGNIIDFSPYGYDERQYGSPGFNLPVGLLQRSPFGTFPEYHTSADNLDFITPAALQNSYEILQSAIGILERDRVLLNLSPKCEPQLGKRNAYAAIGGSNAEQSRMALLWVLNQSDGTQSLFDIATRAKLAVRSRLRRRRATRRYRTGAYRRPARQDRNLTTTG